MRHLRYFLAVFEELHFGRAAERLFMKQPPLSQAIRKLEGELGVQLFDRTGRRIAPTQAGRAFAEEARKVLAAFDRAVLETRRTVVTRNPVRIGHGPCLPARNLLRFLEALSARYPDVATEVRHLGTLEQMSRLRRGELDLGIFPHSSDPSDLEQVALFPGESLQAFVVNGGRLAARERLTPSDLRAESLLIFTRAAHPALFDWLVGELERAGYSFGGVTEAGPDARDLLLGAVVTAGVTILPETLTSTAEAVPGIVRRPLDPETHMPETVLAWSMAGPPPVPDGASGLREIVRALRSRP